MTKKEFITRIAPFAITDMSKTNIAASLTIAQAALESAWGGSGLTKQGNNLFGIKGSGTAGSVTMQTTEYVSGRPIKVNAAFRAYKTWGESIADHSKLIINGVSWNRNLYKGVIGKRGVDAARAIAAAGYATDPKYAEKLISIMNEWNLYQYDGAGSTPVREKGDKLELSNYQWQSLHNGVTELISKGKITDKTWLDKIDERTLTVSELTWLTFTVATR